MVYVRNDGDVRFKFTQPKQILEMYRLLCAGKTEFIPELCKAFNAETNDGKNMEAYSKMLLNAIKNTLSLLNQRNEIQLEGKGAKLIDENELPKEQSDFELITWLIIK